MADRPKQAYVLRCLNFDREAPVVNDDGDGCCACRVCVADAEIAKLKAENAALRDAIAVVLRWYERDQGRPDQGKIRARLRAALGKVGGK